MTAANVVFKYAISADSDPVSLKKALLLFVCMKKPQCLAIEIFSITAAVAKYQWLTAWRLLISCAAKYQAWRVLAWPALGNQWRKY